MIINSETMAWKPGRDGIQKRKIMVSNSELSHYSLGSACVLWKCLWEYVLEVLKCQQALFILHSPSSGITVGEDLTVWSTSVQNIETLNAKAVVCL